MAKFSEFMQHSQLIAQLLKGQDTETTQDGEDAGDATAPTDTTDPADLPAHALTTQHTDAMPGASMPEAQKSDHATADAPTDTATGLDVVIDAAAEDDSPATLAEDQVISQDGIVTQIDTSSVPATTAPATTAAAADYTSLTDEYSDDVPDEPDSVEDTATLIAVAIANAQASAAKPTSHSALTEHPENLDVDVDDDPEDPSDQYSESAWEEALATLKTPPRPLQRLLPMTARVGVLGLVAFAMWWTWPRNDDPALWITDARAGDLPSLAVVNPINVEQTGIVARAATPESTEQAEQFSNIVIVTPTSMQVSSASEDDAAADLDEPLVLEASGLVTDDTTGTIIIEIPEAVPVEELMPALEEETAEAAQLDVVLIPTATPVPPTQPDSATEIAAVPKVEIVPAVGVSFTPTAGAPTPTATPTEVPTATPAPIGPGRLWSTFTPLPAAESDHFWIGNPFEGLSSNRFASPSYQFGSTAGNRYRPHHGLDFSNPSGTPVQAAVEGTVVHAGPDDPDVLGPYPNFYGQAVVIRLARQLPVAGGQLDVFVLYGHLSEVRVEVGQEVQPSDIVGLVGMTGIAIGPHLHVEARLGANTYDHSVNPYLWLAPAEGNGAVAVRILTAKGRTWAGAKVSIARFEGGRAVWGRQIETYLDTENIGPDPLWGENGAMGDVPAGSYYLIATINGESVRAEFTVNAGETTFVEIRTEQ